jgi:hypothetical protein
MSTPHLRVTHDHVADANWRSDATTETYPPTSLGIRENRHQFRRHPIAVPYPDLNRELFIFGAAREFAGFSGMRTLHDVWTPCASDNFNEDSSNGANCVRLKRFLPRR